MAAVTLTDREQNEVVRNRTGVVTELANRVDKRAVKLFHCMDRMDERRLKIASVVCCWPVVVFQYDGPGVNQ